MSADASRGLLQLSADEMRAFGYVDALIADGFAMVATTVLRGRTVLRLCTINPRTTEADLEATIARIEWLAQRERHAGGRGGAIRLQPALPPRLASLLRPAHAAGGETSRRV